MGSLRTSAVLLVINGVGFGLPCVLAIRNLLAGRGIPFIMWLSGLRERPVRTHRHFYDRAPTRSVPAHLLTRDHGRWALVERGNEWRDPGAGAPAPGRCLLVGIRVAHPPQSSRWFAPCLSCSIGSISVSKRKSRLRSGLERLAKSETCPAIWRSSRDRRRRLPVSIRASALADSVPAHAQVLTTQLQGISGRGST